MTDLIVELRVKNGARDYEVLTSRTFSYTEKREIEAVLNNEAAVLWDAAASGALADFDVAILYSDQPVEIELTCNEGDGDEELSHFTLAKNTPVVLGSNAARYTYTTDAFAGTLDVIDKIRAKETNSVAATVTLLLFT